MDIETHVSINAFLCVHVHVCACLHTYIPELCTLRGTGSSDYLRAMEQAKCLDLNF